MRYVVSNSSQRELKLALQDCELLGLRPETGRPEEYIWQYISVPPVCIRPSVAQDGASNEDDLTVKLTEIVFTSALIRKGLASGAPTPQFMVRLCDIINETL